MGKKGVLSTLRFVLFTMVSLAMIFVAVYLTIINTYKPVVKTYINGEFVGYYSSEQQFDEVYNDLVSEKQSVDENVKVYLEGEPTFEKSYIRDDVLLEQNVYTTLRAEMKTEYTIYEIAVDGEVQMTFTDEEQANEYADKLTSEVEGLTVDVTVEKVAEVEEITSTERAEAILSEIVDRNRPVEIPDTSIEETTTETTTTTTVASAYQTTTSTNVSPVISGDMAWPTVSRVVNCDYQEYYGHAGVDLNAPLGTDVYAFMAGTVTFSGWNSYGLGYCVQIDHGNGFVTIYGHCSALYVTAGQTVSVGQLIAASGSTGNSTGPHLHFETRVNGVAVSPWIYLNLV